ncbi:MAG: hypothetical protein S4CHLAM7_03210 [Chlamydiae bacterium]|nr:hypothetical protein [Chlamydiota bacterium]
MRNKNHLLIGGSMNFFVALIHLIALCIGASAYEFMGAPEFAFYAHMGSSIPFWIMLFTATCFAFFGFYAFCFAGGKIKLPMQSILVKGIAYLFLIRGISVMWFIYLQWAQSPNASLKEIGFSLYALLVGILYFMGTKKSKITKYPVNA